MPELPDVEIFRRYLDATALHKEIERIHVLDDQILEGDTPQSLGRKLAHRRMDHTRRHGKYLFARLDDGRWLSFHFGMTGHLKYYRDPADEPEYTYARLAFTNGYQLAFVIPRKLGTLRHLDSPGSLIEEKDLGPDPYNVDFKEDDFVGLLADRRGMIKTTLMNQSVMAGIGNVYSDEILFQERLHPRTKVKKLQSGNLRHLYGTLCSVVSTAIDLEADPDRFPDDWLIPVRSEGEDCPHCDGQVERIVISGRGCYYCPNCQEL
ncbi:MAG: DNA-formamidopyrimidine glycosylase family protein [Anaerolineales bacterium]|jgi:formamidopyrimidine-DNA glycosylase